MGGGCCLKGGGTGPDCCALSVLAAPKPARGPRPMAECWAAAAAKKGDGGGGPTIRKKYFEYIWKCGFMRTNLSGFLQTQLCFC